MEKIGVISDTHGDIMAVKRCIAAAPDMNMWLHLGDIVPDALELAKLSGKPIHAVAGNCDGLMLQTKGIYFGEAVIQVEDVKLLMLHGHLHGVDADTQRAVYRAEERGCGVLLYGHTHISQISSSGNVVAINPGSPSRPRSGRKPSFAQLEIDGTKVRAHIVVI